MLLLVRLEFGRISTILLDIAISQCHACTYRNINFYNLTVSTPSEWICHIFINWLINISVCSSRRMSNLGARKDTRNGGVQAQDLWPFLVPGRPGRFLWFQVTQHRTLQQLKNGLFSRCIIFVWNTSCPSELTYRRTGIKGALVTISYIGLVRYTAKSRSWRQQWSLGVE